MKRLLFTLLAACSMLVACRPPAPDQLGYKVISTKEHDPNAFTQGLQLVDGRLFESTGQYGESTVRELDPATGKVLRKRPLAKTVFGEGLTLHNKELWVLTWKENTAYVMEPDTFKPIRTHTYKGEGWGLTSDGKQLIMSDGSSELKFIDASTFTVTRTVEVLDGNTPIRNLNELEWVDGEIYANIFTSDRIAKISPKDGRVTGWLDLSGLRRQLQPRGRSEVLNGIAYDSKTGHLLVTGKYWPQMFELKVEKK